MDTENKLLTEQQESLIYENRKSMREPEQIEKICELGTRPHRRDFRMHLRNMSGSP